jgi:hypothetical protein
VQHLVNQCTDFYSDYKDAEDNEHEQTFESISETDFEEENWFANGEVDFYGDNERDEYGGRVNEDFYEGCEGEDCDIGGMEDISMVMVKDIILVMMNSKKVTDSLMLKMIMIHLKLWRRKLISSMTMECLSVEFVNMLSCGKRM